MKWINTLEMKFGRHAIHGLIRIIITFNVLVFMLSLLKPHFSDALVFDKDLILQGQVWRLFTYIFVPPSEGIFGANLLVLVLYYYFLWFIGDGLEQAMGAFKLNVFYLLGMIGTTIAAFFFGSDFSNSMLNASLFYAFARFYPDLVIYVMLILPVKVRWLAWIFGCGLILGFVLGDMSYRMAVVAAFLNYLVFFGPEIWREAGHRITVTERRQRFKRDALSEDAAMHNCEVCHRTELTNPDLDFRVAADGHEYCVEHLPSKPKAT